ncbi:MAG TPA: sulfite exporter TauE/SafE family protein [Bacteroidales bacterium]|nr:sulfite exporter TauE/SafE family protein [Bacteroidales bacterium]
MGESFLLGLSSGSACLVTCGMVLIPYIISGPAGLRRTVIDLSLFMLTRFLIYLALATAVWYFGKAIFSSVFLRTFLTGTLYTVFAIMLVWYSIGRGRRKDCPAAIVKKVDNLRLVPVMLGITNSLGFCPALLLILTKGASQQTLMQSYLAFVMFFLGSSLWFVPLPFAGKLKRKETLELIGTMATGVAGVIFFVKGLTLIIGGLING